MHSRDCLLCHTLFLEPTEHNANATSIESLGLLPNKLEEQIISFNLIGRMRSLGGSTEMGPIFLLWPIVYGSFYSNSQFSLILHSEKICIPIYNKTKGHKPK